MTHRWTFLFGEKKLERVCNDAEDADLLVAVKQAKWLSIPGETHYMVNMERVECIIREQVKEPLEILPDDFQLPSNITAEIPPIDDQVA